MSQPKKRKHPHHTNTPAQPAGLRKFSRIIPVTVVIFLLFGLGITFFAVGYDVTWLVIGAIAGAVCGYFFGYEVAKTLSKK